MIPLCFKSQSSLSLFLAFKTLQELKTLHMIDSSINELNTRLFLHLAKLKYLDLSMNSIEDLGPEVFKDVQVECRQASTA